MTGIPGLNYPGRSTTRRGPDPPIADRQSRPVVGHDVGPGVGGRLFLPLAPDWTVRRKAQEVVAR
jgi:hypothetical protein